MRIVVVGDGKVGYTLAQQLSKENHDVVVIDSNSEVLQHSLETLDIMVVNGNGASLEAQQEAGVDKSNLLIAVTSADEVNLLCCILARKMGCKHTIARVRNPEYIQQIRYLNEELGLSMIINPERSAAWEISRLLQFPSFINRDSFAKGMAELVELKIKPGSVLDGIMLGQMYEIAKVKVLVCAVERGEEVFVPKGSTTLKGGDSIVVTAATHDLAKLIKNLGIATQKIRNVMIVGGSRIAIYLTERLKRSGIEVKIIEKDAEKCKALSQCLPDALVIHGDGSIQDLLLSEGIREADAVVTLTNIDEENLVISMYANYMGVPKSITKINRIEYGVIFNNKGIDSVVSPKLISATEIVRYVRDMQNTTGGSVLTLHRIFDGKIDALEFKATEKTKYLDTPLRQLPLKDNILLVCINRAGKIIIPNGNEEIKQGDAVVIVTPSERTISALNEIYLSGEQM